ncbi:uncharacterized protein SEPMUDRAFT_148069 [Sphaerulina musiva SO2202]|uniref:Uncharacterized protein n=1 Tax=Sphaerulina musiva (strain SO2202) TaxID=692275 RepID=M3CKM1_SPHMS|nr:uncharacterized protein SEPMUDRAFT_148069 [Sphaerulina musiva SO2202]EMF14318.1 hypothetical protein SEPMUDRAFT_148069 [Sphaerulina musiva SO2202]
MTFNELESVPRSFEHGLPTKDPPRLPSGQKRLESEDWDLFGRNTRRTSFSTKAYCNIGSIRT